MSSKATLAQLCDTLAAESSLRFQRSRFRLLVFFAVSRTLAENTCADSEEVGGSNSGIHAVVSCFRSRSCGRSWFWSFRGFSAVCTHVVQEADFDSQAAENTNFQCVLALCQSAEPARHSTSATITRQVIFLSCPADEFEASLSCSVRLGEFGTSTASLSSLARSFCHVKDGSMDSHLLDGKCWWWDGQLRSRDLRWCDDLCWLTNVFLQVRQTWWAKQLLV